MSVKVADGAGVNPDAKTNPSGQLMTTDYKDTLSGVYTYASAAFVVAATAHANNTGGFFWLLNKTGSGKKLRIKKMEVQTQIGSVLLTPTSPRLAYALMTFTGTPTGASGVVAKHDSLYPSPQGDIRTAITGLTCVYGAGAYQALPVANLTAVGAEPPSIAETDSVGRDAEIILREGEGMVFWQPDAGTTADTRRIISKITWEEYS